jgi:hypothetical protein
LAEGGAGGAGADGSAGQGGGCYMQGDATVSFDPTWVVANAALGGAPGAGGTSGEGVGGGLYISTDAVVTLSKSTEVFFNFASTSADDIFGSYTVS